MVKSKTMKITGRLLLAIILFGPFVQAQDFEHFDKTKKVVVTASGLVMQVLHDGSGPMSKKGDKVLIHETTLKVDSTVVTDTWKMNFPIPFTLGAKQIIDGLDEAVTGMRVGERRKVIVPPNLSMRTTYPDIIKPSDTLYYDVILIQIIEEAKE